MNGMDMDGMDMSSSGMFRRTNQAIARGFWYGVAGCVGLLAVIRIVRLWERSRRLTIHRRHPHMVASRPRGWFSQIWATATAMLRELTYWQPVCFTGRVSRFFTPLPVGRWLILAVYWTAILGFLWSGTIYKPGDRMYAYRFEGIGFRAAWVSVTQIPFVFLLSCKYNPVSLLTGISYERLNWLHRWASRTVFLTAIVHWANFFAEWSLADVVAAELKMMTMVSYGFGAWGVLTWMILSGCGFFRHMSYEIFVLQHIAAAATLLWLVFMHVPAYAMYNVHMSVAFMAFDWSVRIVGGILRNTHILGGLASMVPGYKTTLESLPGDVIRLTIADIDFTWEAGQHIYLVVPALRPFEAHPFTIANAPCSGDGQPAKDITLLIQARKGFSRSLLKAARRASGKIAMRRSFLSGPWGMPPSLSHYDTVVLIACSTGASFVVPLLQNLICNPGCVRKATLHWIIRDEKHYRWFERELEALSAASRVLQMDLEVSIHVTGQGGARTSVDSVGSITRNESSATTDKSSLQDEKHMNATSISVSSVRQEVTARTAQGAFYFRGRPSIESLVRPAVEGAWGETAVVVCGGASVTTQSRTFVAALSDERAVHKGTGAQGIFLFTETYGW